MEGWEGAGAESRRRGEAWREGAENEATHQTVEIGTSGLAGPRGGREGRMDGEAWQRGRGGEEERGREEEQSGGRATEGGGG